jgi:nitrate/nitrite-specific signal transduction histidine kinase
LSVLALVAAGCGGGGNSDQKANEAYAKGVCTAIGSWTTEVKSLATVPTSGVTKASVDAKLSQFETATKNLVTQIKAVPAPNTSEGQSAKKQIDQLTTQVQTTSTAVKSAASKLPANASVTQIVTALSQLVPQFESLKSAAQSTVKTIQSAGGSLADAFKSERACKQLG